MDVAEWCGGGRSRRSVGSDPILFSGWVLRKMVWRGEEKSKTRGMYILYGDNKWLAACTDRRGDDDGLYLEVVWWLILEIHPFHTSDCGPHWTPRKRTWFKQAKQSPPALVRQTGWLCRAEEKAAREREREWLIHCVDINALDCAMRTATDRSRTNRPLDAHMARHEAHPMCIHLNP